MPHMAPFRWQRKDWLAVFLFAALFLAWALPRLRYEPASADELKSGFVAIYLLKGITIWDFARVHIPFLGKNLPVDFFYPYCFTLPFFLVIPFCLVFGITILALKLFSIAFSVASIPLVYYLCAALFGRRVALITTGLWVLSPSFIHYSRMGLHVSETFINFFFFAAMAAFLRYGRCRRSVYLYLGSFLLGLGFSIKLSAAGRLAGLALAAAFIFPRQSWQMLSSRLLRKHLAGLLAVFLLGASLFVYYNFRTKGASFKLLRYMYTDQKTEGGFNNRAYGKNFRLRLRQLTGMVGEDFAAESPYSKEMDWGRHRKMRQIAFRLFLLMVAANVLCMWRDKEAGFRHKKVLALVVLYGTMYALSHFTPLTMRAFHLVCLSVFPQLMLAIFVETPFLLMRRSRVRVSGVVMLICLLPFLMPVATAGWYLQRNLKYQRLLFKTGGRGLSQPVLAELVTHMQNSQSAGARFFFIDGGVNHAVAFFTAGTLRGNIFNYQDYTDPATRDTDIMRLLEMRPTVYFIAQAAGRNFSQLTQDIRRLGRQVVIDYTVANKAGEPQFHIFHAE